MLLMLHLHTSFASKIQQKKKKINMKKYDVVQKLRGSTLWGQQNAKWGGYMDSEGVAQTGDIVISSEP